MKLVVVDIQPEYESNTPFDIGDMLRTAAEDYSRVLFLFNGEDTLGMVSESVLKSFYLEKLDYDEEVFDELLSKSEFFDKGYGFFRDVMDSDVCFDRNQVVKIVKYMINKNIQDIRDLDEEDIEAIGVSELLFDDLEGYGFWIPELSDELPNWSGSDLAGGARNECMAEVEILGAAQGLSFNHIDEFIYEGKDRYSEDATLTEASLRNCIRNLLKEKDELGKYVWPSAIKNHPMADEPDTDIEEMLYKQLHNHFGAIAPLSEKAISILRQILDSGQYADIFRPCKSGPILRGMRLPISWLEKHAPEALETLPTERKDPLDWGAPVRIKPMMYKSEGKYGNVSSWTSDWRAARRFTTQWSSNTVPVILHSDCSTGYFMYTNSFSRFKDGRYRDEFDIRKLNPQGKSESEILLFGECQVTAIEINATKQDIDRLRS